MLARIPRLSSPSKRSCEILRFALLRSRMTTKNSPHFIEIVGVTDSRGRLSLQSFHNPSRRFATQRPAFHQMVGEGLAPPEDIEIKAKSVVYFCPFSGAKRTFYQLAFYFLNPQREEQAPPLPAQGKFLALSVNLTLTNCRDRRSRCGSVTLGV